MKRPDVKIIFQKKGLRFTRSRESVFHVFAENHHPLTPQEVHEQVQGESMDLVTVYRTIEFFCAHNILVPVDHTASGQRYELSELFRPHHHHIICESCGSVEDVSGCGLDPVIKRIRSKTNFRLTRHDLQFYGQCPSCQ